MNLNPNCFLSPSNLNSNFIVGAETSSPSYTDIYRNENLSCSSRIPSKLEIEFTPFHRQVPFVITRFVPQQRCILDVCETIEIAVQVTVTRIVSDATEGPYHTILTDAVDGDNTYVSAIGIDVNSNIANGFILTSNNDNCAWHALNDLSSNQTIILGLDKIENIDEIIIAGATAKENYVASLYQGPLNGNGVWTYLNIPTDTILYNSWATKIMEGIVIGSYTTIDKDFKSFIYDTQNSQYYQLNYPGSAFTIAGDIWSNGRPYYTIVGGYINKNITKTDNLNELDKIINSGAAFMVRWNSDTGHFSNWKTFYLDNSKTLGVLTAFTGISSNGYDEYHLIAENFNQLTEFANSIPFLSPYLRGGLNNYYDGYITNSVVTVPINSMNGFGSAYWIDYGITQEDSNQHLESSARGIIGNTIFGTYNGSGYAIDFTSCLEVC